MTSLPPQAPSAPAGRPVATDPFTAVIDGVRQQPNDAHDHDILTTADASRRLGVFVDFARAAGLTALLLGPGPFTVLAPTERAFLKMSLRERDALLADASRLTRVMRGHILAGRIMPPRIGHSTTVTTIDGDIRVLTSGDGASRVDGARIIQANVRASNGLIHAIDSLLL